MSLARPGVRGRSESDPFSGAYGAEASGHDVGAVKGVRGAGAVRRGPGRCPMLAASLLMIGRQGSASTARQGINLVTLSACQLLAATVMFAIGLGVAGAPIPRLGVTVFAGIAILGRVGTWAAYVLNYQTIISEGAMASTVTHLLPIIAIALGVAVLGESHGPVIVV